MLRDARLAFTDATNALVVLVGWLVGNFDAALPDAGMWSRQVLAKTLLLERVEAEFLRGFALAEAAQAAEFALASE